MKYVLAFLLLAGCDFLQDPPRPARTQTVFQAELNGIYTEVHRFYDKEAGVYCWIYARGGISCLPKNQVNIGTP